MSVEQNTDRVPLKVHSVQGGPNTDTQIVILRDETNADVLPIWVGAAEGASIRLALEDIVPPRPTSHDLMMDLSAHLGITVTRVVVTDVQNNTYHAAVHLSANGREQTVDARPSDAIALALRAKCPIYVTQDVMKKSGGETGMAWKAKLDQKESGQADT